MAKAQDFTGIMKEMMAGFPMDTLNVQDAFKAQASFGEKLTKVALEAAEKSADLSGKWTKEMLARTGNVSKVQEDPADYNKVVSDFAAAQAELATENLAAFAEIAKKVQMETVELVMAAGKDLSDDAAAAVKKTAAKK